MNSHTPSAKHDRDERLHVPVQRVALSYPLSTGAPYPDGGKTPEIVPVSRISDHDISNTSMVTFWNHTGTHIDGPAHVLADREPFTGCCPGTGLYFTNPGVIDVPCDDSRLITARDLEARGTGDREFDLILIRTGYSKHRTVDQARYAERNPGISVPAARFLAEQFHRLGCIGIDAISFAAAEHLNEGLEAHRILLDREPPILLLEDVNLDYNLRALTKVMVIPFFIEDIDSCPCTVVAEFARSTTRVRTG